MQKIRKLIVLFVCFLLSVSPALSNITMIRAEEVSKQEAETITVGSQIYKIKEKRMDTDYEEFTNDMNGTKPPAPWGVNGRKVGVNNVVSVVYSEERGTVVKFETNTNGKLSLVRYFNNTKNPEITGKALLETKLCLEDKDITRNIFVLYDGSKYINTLVAGKDGHLKMMNKDLVEYEIGKWYHIQMLVDTDKGEIELFIDGQKQGIYSNEMGREIKSIQIVQVGEIVR